MFIIRLVLLVVFCLLPGLAAAGSIDLKDVVATLETPFKKTTQAQTGTSNRGISAFQAAFFQEAKIAAIDREQHGEGVVSFKFLPGPNDNRPVAMFRWQYRLPTDQEIISDGRTLWVYQPENRQVIETDISRATEQQEQNPVTFLSGLGNLSRDFEISWSSPDHDAAGNSLLDLQPRRESQLIQTLQLVVAREAVETYVQKQSTGTIFPILATRVIDPNGNLTTIEFRDTRVNPELPDNFFSFVRPDGVEVVRPVGAPTGY